MADQEFFLTIDLNVLENLGINLYSNIPAVISEAVANSWDADADRVDIDIDNGGIITITDTGIGMTKDECNQKYLSVGYHRRESEPTITKGRRHVMGRKGIGKLSLFSIAKTIEVHTVKRDEKGNVISKCGFVMDSDKIKEYVKNRKTGACPLESVDVNKITIGKGTKLILTSLKKNVDATEKFLKKRLARRFSIIGDKNNFQVYVNRNPITVADRDFFDKIEYLWYIGDDSKFYVDECANCSKSEKVEDEIVDGGNTFKISGWIGTFDEQKNIEEGNNTIIVQAWGKLLHEDLLKDIKEGGLFTKYLIGEIHSDFVDADDLEDMSASDRQNLRENDPRFQALKKHVAEKILNHIQGKWTSWRTEQAETKARKIPAIDEWFKQLGPDSKKYARQLFGKIESFPVPDPNYKKELYRNGILAFETLALTDKLSTLESINTLEDFELLNGVIKEMDDLEAVHYYQIVKTRLGVLKKFEDILPEAKERVLQEHIFNHLWLLDPSWERASTDARFEERLTKEFKKIKLTDEEEKGRIDIRYKTAAGKHIIIELKKYNASVSATDLLAQVRKYKLALEKCLEESFPGVEHDIEIVCILGSSPSPKSKDKENRKMFDAIGMRYITYDQLIEKTQKNYKDYFDNKKEIGRIEELIKKIN